MNKRLRVKYIRSYMTVHPGGNCLEPVRNPCLSRSSARKAAFSEIDTEASLPGCAAQDQRDPMLEQIYRLQTKNVDSRFYQIGNHYFAIEIF